VKPLAYRVPWDQVYSLAPHIAQGTRRNVDEFSAAIVSRMDPAPLYEGLDLLPGDARFLLVSNHYQRKGLWILHSAAALTQAIRRRYGPGDPPVRWLVTANWPPLRMGPLKFPSPGDWLLPRVANALHCYPVTFAGSNPKFTARTLRRVLQDARSAERPIGLFPEGAGGSAGVLTAPLPGVDRLIVQLARIGLPVVPAAIREAGRLVVRFGTPIPTASLLSAPDAAALSMSRIAALLEVA
jgi:hypothetical protein